jgi:signal transduction histidine kinase
VVEGFVQPAKDKGLSLEYQGGAATLLVDPERFRQVAVNLVGNAVKYTERGEVRVSSKTSGSRYLLRVSDTGLGISAENQKRLFEKFYRVKTEATARIEGTGLGLWITKAMIEAMGGRISVESIEGKGSDFIVEFPLA